MAKQSGRQKEIVGRVMHEFKHGELESAGRKVRNPRQAIAIGLSEAGSSNRKSPSENRRSRSRTETEGAQRRDSAAAQGRPRQGGQRGPGAVRPRSGQANGYWRWRGFGQAGPQSRPAR